MKRVLLPTTCALLAGAFLARATIVQVNYEGTNYEEMIGATVSYGNEKLLMSQPWYGNAAMADDFAQAWLNQDGGGYNKQTGWPDWVTTLNLNPSGNETWQGVTLGPVNDGLTPTFLEPTSGGYLGGFVMAEIGSQSAPDPVPESSGWLTDAFLACPFLCQGLLYLRRQRRS